MRKIAAGILAFLVLIIPSFAMALEVEGAEEEVEKSLEQGIGEVLGEIDFSEMEEVYESTGRAFLEEDLEDAIQKISREGLSQITAEEALNAVFSELKTAFFSGLPYLVSIIILLLIIGLLKHLPGANSEGSAAKTAFFAGYIISATLAVAMLMQCVTVAKNAIETLFSVTETITPVLMTLLTGLGGVTSSSVMSPVMAALTGSIFDVIKTVVFPIVMVAAVLILISNISTTIRLDRMAGLLISVVKWFLGIVFTVFLSVLALKGLAGSAIDGISFKTAKYTVDKMVPVIGKMFSDTLDTLMACGLIVKNAVGTVGMLVLFAAMMAPLATLIIHIFLFKGGAAIVQPFSDHQEMFLQMGKVTELLFLVVLTCAAMAFISVALFIGAANTGFMLR